MSYSVDLQFTINEDFSNPQTISESGQPSEMTLQGLQASQTYYTKAVLKNDGVVEDESQMTSFQTLQAGTITLNHYQTTRSGYAYDVTYLYSSTYAPSWCTLSVNGSTFQGVFDSAQHAVSFLVTGLTPGTAYLDLVTLGDIYGETGSVQGSIVTTVVNDIDITSVDAEFTTADVNIDYIVDGGFYVGYVEWWLSTQDPSTDPAEGHEYFNNGAETVTINGLSEGTEYMFRASITLADQTTTIVSNVVAAETEIPYAQRYFTIENISNDNNTIYLKQYSNLFNAGSIYVSSDNGVTWVEKHASNTQDVVAATLTPGSSIVVKHNGTLGYGNGGAINDYVYFSSTDEFEVYGSAASLTDGDNFSLGNIVMPNYALTGLLCNSKVSKADNLTFDSYTGLGFYGCDGMFKNCTYLRVAPNLHSTLTDSHCCHEMFRGCSSLKTTPSLPSTTLTDFCYDSMFRDCTALTTINSLPATSLANSCYRLMFYGCSRLTVAPELQATRLATSCYVQMFRKCDSLTTIPVLPSTSLADYCYDSMFRECVSLKQTDCLKNAQVLRYTNKSYFSYMFADCRSLVDVYAPSTSGYWYTAWSKSWLNGVASSGVVHKPSTLSIPTNTVDGVPSGWTTEDY